MGMYDEVFGESSSSANGGLYDDVFKEANKKQNKGIAGDTLTDLKRGVQQLPGAITGIADIVNPLTYATGNRMADTAADWVGDKTGFKPSQWQKDAAKEYSPERQAADKAISDAWENGSASDIAGSYLSNPRSVAGVIGQSVPSMIAGGGIARAAMKGITALSGADMAALGKAAQFEGAAGDAARETINKMATTAGAVGEGAITAGQNMDQVSRDADPSRAALTSLAAGAITGGIGKVSGRVANKLGLPDVETAMAGGGLNSGNMPWYKRIPSSMAQESLIQELPQSAQEQVWQNIAENKPWHEGVARQAIEGALAGAAMGGSAAIPSQQRLTAKPPQAQEQEVSGLLLSPVYPGTPSDQVTQANVDRQNEVDAAQRNADALYGERAAYEQEKTKLQETGALSRAVNAGIDSGATSIDTPLALGYQAGAPLVTFPDGTTMTRAEYEQQRAQQEQARLDGMVQDAPLYRMAERANERTAETAPDRDLANLILEERANIGRRRAEVTNKTNAARAERSQQAIAGDMAQDELAPQPVSPLEKLIASRTDEQLTRLAGQGQRREVQQAAVAEMQRRMSTPAQPTTTAPQQQAATQFNIPENINAAQAEQVAQKETQANDAQTRTESSAAQEAEGVAKGIHREIALHQAKLDEINARREPIVSQYNELVNQYKASDENQKAQIRPVLDGLGSQLDKIGREAMPIMSAVQKANQKLGDIKQRADNAVKYGAMPVGTKLGVIGHESNNDVYWEKTGNDEWTRVGIGSSKPTISNAKMEGVRVIPEQSAPVAKDNMPIKVVNESRGPAPITKRDDLVGAIMRVTGGKGIANSMKLDVTGDTKGNNRTLSGLFTDNGTADLGEIAHLLSLEEGYSVRDGSHLAELVRDAAAGNMTYSMARNEREAAANAEKEYKASVNQKAEELGLKKVGGKRTLAMVEADILAKEQEIKRLESEAERQAIQAADILEDGEVSEAEFMRLLSQNVGYTEEEINAESIRSQERADRKAETLAGYAADEQAQGSVSEGNGNQSPAQGTGRTEAGTRSTEGEQLTPSDTANEDIVRRAKALGMKTAGVSNERLTKQVEESEARNAESGITYKEGKGLAKGKWFAVSEGVMSNAEDTKEQAAESLKSMLENKQATEDRRVALDELAKSVADKIKNGTKPTDKELYDLFGLEAKHDYVFQEAVGAFLVKHLGVSRNKIHEALGKAGGVRTSDFGSKRNIAYPRKFHEVFGNTFDLTKQTNDQAAAEFKRQQEEANKQDEEPAAPTVKADQVDLFNTQDALFNSNRDEAKPATTEADSVIAQAEAIAPDDSQVEPITVSDKARSTGQENKIADFGEKIGGARKDTASPLGPRTKIERAEDERPAWARKYVAMEIMAGSFDRSNIGKWQVMEKISNGRRSGGVSPLSRKSFDTEADAMAALPHLVVAKKHRVYQFTPRNGGEKQYGIFRNITDKKRALVKGGFNTYEEAMQYIADNPVEIIEHKFGYPERPWLDKIDRIGKKRLDGDVSTKMFADTFGFRAGEFGNWNMGGDGQAALNHAYEALLDLAEAIGVPPRALSLDGRLAIAFGARGTGGKGSAAAHYEPGAMVINLTKIKGAGSLAHEWWHAVDHYFAANSGRKDSDSVVSSGYSSIKNDARPELIEAIKNVVDSMMYSTTSQTTDATLIRDRAQKRIDESIKSIDYYNGDLRHYLTNGEYNRGKKVATKEQLAQWDAFIERLKQGDTGEQVYIENPSKMRGAIGFHTGSVIRDMNAIYKSVTGRSFMTKDPQSRGNQLFWQADSIKDNQERLKVKDDVTTAVRGRSSYFVEARNIDNQHTSDYWSSPEEMGARAFESYIFDKITESGDRSDYLVHGVENRFYSALDMYPYPEGEERQRIDKAFDNLFSTIQTKETDNGIAMYSKGNAQGQVITQPEAEKRILSLLGNKLGQVLLDSGIITFTNKGNAYQGATYTNGKIALNLDNLTANNFDGVLQHEGLHSTLREYIGDETYGKLMGQLDSLLKMGKGSQWVKDANAAIPKDTSPENITEEIAAYAVEQYVNGGKLPGVLKRWAQDFLSTLRTAIIKSLPNGKLKTWAISNITAQDLSKLAIAGLKAKAAGQLQAQGREAMAFSQANRFAPTGNGGYIGELKKALMKLTSTDKKTRDQGGAMSIRVMDIPPVLQSVIAKDGSKPFKQAKAGLFGSGSSIASKATDTHAVSKHNGAVSSDVVMNLPKLLSDPIAVFSSEGGMNPNSYRVLVSGAVVAIEPKSNLGFVMTIHPVDTEQVKKWSDSGNLHYVNDRAAEQAYMGQFHTLNAAGVDFTVAKQKAEDKGRTVITRSDVDGLPAEAFLSVGGMRYSKAAQIIGDSGRPYDKTQRDFFKNVGRDINPQTRIEKAADYLKNDFWKKMAIGIVDQFRGLRDLNDNGQAYMLARLSKGTAGAFDALLHHGKLSLKDGVYDADTSGGFVERLGVPLNGELDDVLWWIAANRAEGLAAQGKENLFTPQDIAAGKSLATGKTNFDYTMQTGPLKGKTTRDRAAIYADANRVFNEFQKNTLDMAEQSGLIDGASRQYWESEFYVPFYRVSEEDGEFIGSKMGNAMVRQQAFKKLKGGTDKLNSDLLSNTLLNWSHLIEASAKNRAAKATLTAAEKVGAAHKASYGEKNPVWYMGEITKTIPKGQQYTEGGINKVSDGTAQITYVGKVEYVVDDPFVMTAITSLEYAGMRNGIMDVLTKFKHFLTIGVTASPAFKVRNLIRDSIQAIGTSDLGYNPIKNVVEGFKQTKRDSQEYVSALASGGLIRFGTMLEGSESSRVRQLIKAGVKDSTILNTEKKFQAFYDQYIDPAISAYNELGNRSEEINRAALYNQLIKQGKSHAEAALMARDLMDFSMQGSFNTIRFLAQTVPFFNARLAGAYKLGRSFKDHPQKMAVVTGAAAMASIALMLAYGDDDDWKRREDWDRDTYWWFKLGGIEFRIPKPFELGAVASLAERSLEYMINDEMTGKRFAGVVGDLIGNQMAMNPVPQAMKPIIDLYANYDGFTKRPIESQGMQKLEKEMRYNSSTSMVARGLSTATAGALSPVQYDHLVRSYFGWLGSFVVGGADMAVRAISDEPTKPALDYFKFATQGILKEEGSGSSRYLTQMYEQATKLEKVYSTYRQLIKDGKIADAQEYAADNKDKLSKYRQVESVKRAESKLNDQIRLIERSNIDPSEKKEKIENINRMKEQVAKRIAPGLH